MKVTETTSVDTGVNNADSQAGFPSHLIDPDKKRTPQWCLAFMKGMHERNNQISIFRNNATSYKEWRDYARGKQEIDQYKETPASGNKRNRGKRNNTWKNLDYSIMPIAPKFVRILEGMIMKQPRIVKTKGIDNESLDAERTYEGKLAEYLFNQEWLQKVQTEVNIQANTPIASGDPAPMTMGEIPLYKDLYYKDQNALELKDVIDTVMEVNKFKEQGRRMCVRDSIEVGVLGSKVYIDTNGFIKVRDVRPERVITNTCKKDDFSDIQWAGEYVEMTIMDMKQEAGNQFTEKEYKEIAEKATGNNYSQNNFPSHIEEDIISYPYDSAKITVLDAEWFSADTRTTKVSTNKYGNKMSERVPKDYLPKGVSDDMYKEKSGGKSYLMRRNLKNVYRGKWIVGTQFIYNYGLATDMIRMGSSLEDVKLSYSFHTLSFDSLMRMIKPILNQIQVNWLQFQNHNARSRPSGLSIEMSALENLTLGKAGEKMTPKDAIKLYMETGILVWRRKEWSGHTSQWRPVEELQNQPSTGAVQSLQNILSMIDMLRNILGINEVSDASTPNPEIGKFVTESAMVATQDAINYLYYADKKLYEETAEKVALLLPDLIKRGPSKAFIESLGLRTYNFFKKNIDLTRYQFSTRIEAGYSDEQRAIVQKYMELAVSNMEISGDWAIKIENEENPHKQAAMLRQAKLEKIKENQEKAQAESEMQTESNIASAQAASEAKIAENKALAKLEMQKDANKHELTIKEQNNLVKGQIVLEKLKAGIALTEQEEALAASLMETNIQARTSIKVAEIGAKASEKAAAARPKPTTSKAKAK
jgi:hypothetical protein